MSVSKNLDIPLSNHIVIIYIIVMLRTGVGAKLHPSLVPLKVHIRTSWVQFTLLFDGFRPWYIGPTFKLMQRVITEP